MNTFKPTCIYIKKCSHCNLKYLGITTQDINKYKGSGIKWKNHLNKNHSTQINIFIKYIKNEDYFYKCCNQLSKFLNIIENKEYANLINEDGLCGGDKISCKSEEERNKIKKKQSNSHKNRS